MSFLQQNGYVKTNQKSKYTVNNFKNWDNIGELDGTKYTIQDSIHNHIRFKDKVIVIAKLI